MKRLADALSEQGVRVWYDETEIEPGDPLLERMEEGLRKSACVVFVITPETVHSNWMAAELGAALALEKRVIAVVSEDSPVEDLSGPIRLRKYLLKGDPKAVAEEIARRVTGEGETKATPVIHTA